jgi:hypothetical protein
MGLLSHNELIGRLGTDTSIPSELVDLGIVTEGKRRRPRRDEPVSFRRALFFADRDLEWTGHAVVSLKWLAVDAPISWSGLATDGLSYTLLSQRYRNLADAMRPEHQKDFVTIWRALGADAEKRGVIGCASQVGVGHGD